jgi:outer membrane protein TolC
MEEGQQSNFEVLSQLRRLYEAKSGEIAAQAELNRSILQLWLATGTLFQQLGIQVPEDHP